MNVSLMSPIYTKLQVRGSHRSEGSSQLEDKSSPARNPPNPEAESAFKLWGEGRGEVMMAGPRVKSDVVCAHVLRASSGEGGRGKSTIWDDPGDGERNGIMWFASRLMACDNPPPEG